MLQKISKAVNRVLSVFACAFTLAFCASVIIQIVSRTLLPKVPSWTEEVARYCFIYAVACGAGLAVQGNAYVAVDILTNMIPPALKRAYAIALHSLLTAFALFFEVNAAWRFANLKARLVSTALEIPMQYIYVAMLILFGMLTLTFLLEVIRLVSGGPVKEAVLQ